MQYIHVLLCIGIFISINAMETDPNKYASLITAGKMAELEQRIAAAEQRAREAEVSLAALKKSKQTIQDMPVKPVIQAPKFFIPTINTVQKMNENEYRQVLNSFKATTWRVRYDATTKNYKVGIYASHGAIHNRNITSEPVFEYDFKDYKKVIVDAYNSIDGKQPEEIVDGDPALNLYSYITYLRTIPWNARYMTADEKYRKMILEAFESNNTHDLSVYGGIMDQKFSMILEELATKANNNNRKMQ